MADLGAIADSSLRTLRSDELIEPWESNGADNSLRTLRMVLDGVHGPFWDNNGANRSQQTYRSRVDEIHGPPWDNNGGSRSLKTDRSSPTVNIVLTPAVFNIAWDVSALLSATDAPEPPLPPVTPPTTDPGLNVYKSALAEPAGANSCIECPFDLAVTITPVSGSTVELPLYVFLNTNYTQADIRYTLDNKPVDYNSTLYTAPIVIPDPLLLTDIHTVIRAAAFIPDCPPSQEIVANYQQAIPFKFEYLCDTPDNAGPWGDFTSDGSPDHHWKLQFTFAANTTITRIEVYQLDGSGQWTTGQAWATDSPIHPYADEPTKEFDVYPLVIFEAAVQQNFAYLDSYGAFLAGSYNWDLYGDIQTPATNFFQVKMFLATGVVIEQIINTNCTPSTPVCPSPAAPTLTPLCDGKIDVSFTVTAGLNWRLNIALLDCGGTGAYELHSEGVGLGALQTVNVTGLNQGCTYGFYLAVEYPAGCGFRASPTVQTFTPAMPGVDVSTDKIIVDPGETFTISWFSNNLHTTACGGCAAGEIKTPFGCKPGNTSGSQLTSEATCGTKTYEVSGCNPCGSALSFVQVEVRCVATCSGPQPEEVGMANHLNLFGPECLNVAACLSLECEVCSPAVVWNGRLFSIGDSDPPDFICSYAAQAGDCLGNQTMFGCTYTENCGGNLCMYALGRALIDFRPSLARWELEITSCTHLLWFGTKTVGSDPTGTYNKTGGCAGGPATITITL